jgi:hypothetical protein
MGNSETKQGKAKTRYPGLEAINKGLRFLLSLIPSDEIEEGDLNNMWRDCVGTRPFLPKKELQEFIRCLFAVPEFLPSLTLL